MEIVNIKATFRHHYDLDGRPLLVIIPSRYFPKEVSDLKVVTQYMHYILQRCFDEMPPHMDSFCAFVDCKNVKKDNISMSHTKALIPILLN